MTKRATHIDLTVRHFGDRSVAKLDAIGATILGLEPTQAGPLYNVERDGTAELLTFHQVTDLLGW